VTWSPDVEMPSWWEEARRKDPLLYVTMGSSGDTRVLRALFAAIANLSVTAVVATAGRPMPDPLPPNVYAAKYLPAPRVLRGAALCVFNGGAATGYQALTEGVPVLGLPVNADQFHHIECVEAAGAGILSRPSRATPARLAASIRNMLSQPRFREAAKYLQCEISRHPATANFLRIVEGLMPIRHPTAKAGQPPGRVPDKAGLREAMAASTGPGREDPC
jgi:UDP:flavonoid glycosyltransferase YjiC (YdhE family)